MRTTFYSVLERINISDYWSANASPFLPSPHNSIWSDDDKRAGGKEGERVGAVLAVEGERRGGHVLLFCPAVL